MTSQTQGLPGVTLGAGGPLGSGLAATSTTGPTGPGVASTNSSSSDLCVYKAVGDQARLSSGDVSAHGWWDVVSGQCLSDKALVVASMEIYLRGKWYLEGSKPEGAFYPGGGRGQRVTARFACKNSNLNTWRIIVTAQLAVGNVSDSTDYGLKNELRCGIIAGD
ncbi:MAG: hypothetical protein ACP5H2_08785 [Solirubrobacteraceae bacterium]